MSNFLSKFATAAALMVTCAAPANAGVIGITSQGYDGPAAAGEIMVQNFDAALAAGYTMSWSNASRSAGTTARICTGASGRVAGTGLIGPA